MDNPTELVQMSFSVGEVIQILGGAFILYRGYVAIMAKINSNHLEVIKNVGEITEKVNQKITDMDKDLTEKITEAKEVTRKDFEQKLEALRQELDSKVENLRTEVAELRLKIATLED